MSQIQKLPFNLEAEQSIIGSIFIDKDSFSQVSNITPEDFYDEKHKRIWEAIIHCHENDIPTDLLTVPDVLEKNGFLQLTGGIDYLAEMASQVPTSAHIKSYSQLVLESSSRRRLISLGNQIIKASSNEKVDLSKIIESIENNKNTIGKNFYSKDEGSIENALKQIDYTKNLMKKFGGKLGYSSIFPEIDKLTQGTIPGKTYTIGAYSNTGKSRLSYPMVNNFLEQGLKVYYFSLEVSAGDLMLHLQSAKNRMYFNYEHKIDLEFYKNLRVFDDKNKLQDIKQIIEINKPDIVFIDFIQNVDCPGSSEYEKMTAYAKDIQKTAIKTKSAIISLSQLANDTAKNVNLGGSDFISLKGSGALTASSDVVMILKNGEDIGNRKTLDVKLQKNKFGRNSDVFVLGADFGRYQFEYISLKEKERIETKNFMKISSKNKNYKD